MRLALCQQFNFDAAHRLTNVPAEHKCGRPHGHNYVVQIEVEGERDARAGWVMDYGAIKEICRPVIQALDHRSLNELPGLENPTAENLALWLWGQIKPKLPALSAVTVKETAETSCTYRGP